LFDPPGIQIVTDSIYSADLSLDLTLKLGTKCMQLAAAWQKITVKVCLYRTRPRLQLCGVRERM